MTNPAPLDPTAEAEAVDLIRSLCVVAGDTAAVLHVMRKYAAEHDVDTLLAISGLALLVTYSRCLPGPVALPDTPTSKENHA